MNLFFNLRTGDTYAADPTGHVSRGHHHDEDAHVACVFGMPM